MKKIISVILSIIVLIVTVVACADVKIPADVMIKAVADKDAGSIIQDYLYPFLESNDVSSLLFASELNISNGCPHIRSLSDGGWGERAMFGRLITSGTVMKYLNTDNINPRMDNKYLAGMVREETFRLLFGSEKFTGKIMHPLVNTGWIGKGKTTFKFGYRVKGKVLDLSIGKFVKKNHAVYGVLVTHITEYSGERRFAFIACDWKHEKDGFYTASFGIVR